MKELNEPEFKCYGEAVNYCIKNDISIKRIAKVMVLPSLVIVSYAIIPRNKNN